MSAQGVSHDKWVSYHESRYGALQSVEFGKVNMYMPYSDGYPQVNVAAAKLLQHRKDFIFQRRTLLEQYNCPNDELVIVCPVAETGPLGDDFTFMGMRVIPEHSATEYRVVWERPV